MTTTSLHLITIEDHRQIRNMTKSQLIEELSTRLKLSKGKAQVTVNTVFDALRDAMIREERIEIRGFGSFEVRHYDSYEGRNPRTGVPVHVAPKKLPFFKAGKELRERINAASRLHDE